jgi:glycosyltransferase involved in cell wall biosynthesis
MPFFSIVIPTYNSERTLRVALDSVLHQSFRDLEVIIIDGESTDDTLFIVKEYCCKDKRVRWVSEKDEGIYDAMNKGIHLSKGGWLYFMGSDDSFYNESVLEEVSRFIMNTEPWLNIIYGKVFMDFYTGKFRSDIDLLYYCLCHQAIFYKKEIFDFIGLFSLKYNVNADWYHNLMWYSSKKVKYSYIDCCIANYARNGYSSIHKDKNFQKDLNSIIIRYLKRLHLRNLLQFFEGKRYWQYSSLVSYVRNEAIISFYLVKTILKAFLTVLAFLRKE